MSGPIRPDPEFAWFPFRQWQVNPPFLEGRLNVKDPWANRDAWRYHAFFSKSNRIRSMFPGLGIGTAAFAVYLAYDKWFQTQGPGKEENEKWAKWTEEREKRLAASGHGHGHH
ncbi:hypothetical protein SpCBS45565_g01367 [Spizellomyces sp. 'palustris']|nr:hypothetical protein SpCBS45565_g01367 [Spizellomyces sp. 'palustris']